MNPAEPNDIGEFLSGACSLRAAHLKSLNMYVYLFGDMHNNNNECVQGTDISRFLEYSILNHLSTFKDIPIDVFFEESYKKIPGFGRSFAEYAGSFIRTHNMLEALKAAHGSEARLRIHYTDYRVCPLTYENAIQNRAIVSEQMRATGSFERYVNRERARALNELDNDLNAPMPNDEKSRLRKQHDALDSKYLKTEIARLARIYSTVYDDPEFMQCAHFSDILNKKDFDIASAAFEVCSQVYSIYIELYTLFRMLRTFRTHDSKLKRCRHVLLYMGDQHVRAIWYVLTHLSNYNPTIMWDQKRVELSNRVDLQCLSIPTIFKHMWRLFEPKVAHVGISDYIIEITQGAKLVIKNGGNHFNIHNIQFDPNATDVEAAALIDYLILFAARENKYLVVKIPQSLVDALDHVIRLLARANFSRVGWTMNNTVYVMRRDLDVPPQVLYKVQPLRPLHTLVP